MEPCEDIGLHKNIRNTPSIRAEMAASSETPAILAFRCSVSEGNVKNESVYTAFIMHR